MDPVQTFGSPLTMLAQGVQGAHQMIVAKQQAMSDTFQALIGKNMAPSIAGPLAERLHGMPDGSLTNRLNLPTVGSDPLGRLAAAQEAHNALIEKTNLTDQNAMNLAQLRYGQQGSTAADRDFTDYMLGSQKVMAPYTAAAAYAGSHPDYAPRIDLNSFPRGMAPLLQSQVDLNNARGGEATATADYTKQRPRLEQGKDAIQLLLGEMGNAARSGESPTTYIPGATAAIGGVAPGVLNGVGVNPNPMVPQGPAKPTVNAGNFAGRTQSQADTAKAAQRNAFNIAHGHDTTSLAVNKAHDDTRIEAEKIISNTAMQREQIHGSWEEFNKLIGDHADPRRMNGYQFLNDTESDNVKMWQKQRDDLNSIINKQIGAGGADPDTIAKLNDIQKNLTMALKVGEQRRAQFLKDKKGTLDGILGAIQSGMGQGGPSPNGIPAGAPGALPPNYGAGQQYPGEGQILVPANPAGPNFGFRPLGPAPAQPLPAPNAHLPAGKRPLPRNNNTRLMQ